MVSFLMHCPVFGGTEENHKKVVRTASLQRDLKLDHSYKTGYPPHCGIW
jgi:hypothetical protein